MEFWLRYEGQLPSGQKGNNVQAIHNIRRELHPALGKVWETRVRPGGPVGELKESFANRFNHIPPFRFLPLVTTDLKLVCTVRLLVLRTEEPGHLFKRSKEYYGDLDNRIKVFFDALRMPKEPDEVKGLNPGAGEDPFFCLLEDDSVITQFEIETGQIFSLPAHLRPRDVIINAKVFIRITALQYNNMHFLSS